MIISTSSLPIGAMMAVDILKNAGAEAYLVGGCLRDLLMTIPPHDVDIATSAHPCRVKEIFSEYRVIDSGIKHGTVTVIIDELSLEITTYRVDGSYSDGRRPDSVRFSDSLLEDLSRRDFTVNAMAFSSQTGLIDPFNGSVDIEKGTIRAVGAPSVRFQEDGLRILRGLRFSSTLDFTIEADTYKAMLEKGSCILSSSSERIAVELKKLLLGKNVVYALEMGFLLYKIILPTVFSEYSYEEWRERARIVSEMPLDFGYRLAALIAPNDIGDNASYKADELCGRLKLDRAASHKIKSLMECVSMAISAEELCIKQSLMSLGTEAFFALISLKRAQTIVEYGSSAHGLVLLDSIAISAIKILNSGDCLSLKQLAVDGLNVIEWGVENGSTVGTILRLLLNAVVSGKVGNTVDELYRYFQTHLSGI